mmetsp:Transcript_4811/g.10650  ORF Transcript_4811/g.10650 Transcript_4811/m.10650 type:complete len:80 (-) Transcript_4811:331-570(-)
MACCSSPQSVKQQGGQYASLQTGVDRPIQQMQNATLQPDALNTLMQSQQLQMMMFSPNRFDVLYVISNLLFLISRINRM